MPKGATARAVASAEAAEARHCARCPESRCWRLPELSQSGHLEQQAHLAAQQRAVGPAGARQRGGARAWPHGPLSADGAACARAPPAHRNWPSNDPSRTCLDRTS
eukprot:3771770-Alexandrium_andersonii.AAC.1